MSRFWPIAMSDILAVLKEDFVYEKGLGKKQSYCPK